jgi:hypothetical protein
MQQKAAARTCHFVKCWHCGEEFDLLVATWCGCEARVDHPSKVCPYCMQCICSHPDYHDEAGWGSPPRYLKERGFKGLFYLYL